MIRRYLSVILAVILCISAVAAQESQSLGDIARKIKAQENGAQGTSSSAGNSAVAPTASDASKGASAPMPRGRLTVDGPTGIRLEQLYGTTPEHLNKMAYMALIAGDLDFSKKMFDQIGENWDKKTWRTRDNFAQAKRQASRIYGTPY
jgi:hypothetical protein